MTAAIVHKVMRPTFRSTRHPEGPTRNECWQAFITCDGDLYEAERLEEPGTPWQLTRVRDGRDIGWYGSLKRAVVATTRPINHSPGAPPRLTDAMVRLFEAMARRSQLDMIRADIDAGRAGVRVDR